MRMIFIMIWESWEKSLFFGISIPPVVGKIAFIANTVKGMVFNTFEAGFEAYRQWGSAPASVAIGGATLVSEGVNYFFLDSFLNDNENDVAQRFCFAPRQNYKAYVVAKYFSRIVYSFTQYVDVRFIALFLVEQLNNNKERPLTAAEETAVASIALVLVLFKLTNAGEIAGNGIRDCLNPDGYEDKYSQKIRLMTKKLKAYVDDSTTLKCLFITLGSLLHSAESAIPVALFFNTNLRRAFIIAMSATSLLFPLTLIFEGGITLRFLKGELEEEENPRPRFSRNEARLLKFLLRPACTLHGAGDAAKWDLALRHLKVNQWYHLSSILIFLNDWFVTEWIEGTESDEWLENRTKPLALCERIEDGDGIELLSTQPVITTAACYDSVSSDDPAKVGLLA